MSSTHSVGALAGVLMVILMLLCGVLYVAIVARQRQRRSAWAIAIAIAAVAIILACSRLAGGDVARVFSARNFMKFGVVLAIVLPIGMRFALSQL